jgi:pimeloyl-ACP methyl ester carboxylesterase
MKSLPKKLFSATSYKSVLHAVFLLFLLILTQPVWAQSQDWKGAIQIPGSPLGIELRITSDSAATLSIPMQGAEDVPLQNVRRTGGSLRFELPAGPGLATFDGAFITTDSISGQFEQRGQQFPFYLSRTIQKKVKVTAWENTDRTTKEIEVPLSDGVISGTLAYPDQPGKFPLIILISGSGLQTRDENVAGFKVFKEISNYLTRSDYAVFRYDDRGVGKSTVPDPTQSTMEDLAQEVIAIMDRMRDEPMLLADRTVLLGHSQGGMVALEVAKQTRRLEGLILMATPAFSGKRVLLQQIQRNLELVGQSHAQIDSSLQLQKDIYKALDDSASMGEVRKMYQQRIVDQLKRLPAKQREQVGDLETYAKQEVTRQLNRMQAPAMKSFLNYDPVSQLDQVEVPILVLQGGKDVQVVADPNVARFEAAFDSLGIDYRLETFPEANHLFQKANTGMIQEYGALDQAFVSKFLPVITEWLGAHL